MLFLFVKQWKQITYRNVKIRAEGACQLIMPIKCSEHSTGLVNVSYQCFRRTGIIIYFHRTSIFPLPFPFDVDPNSIGGEQVESGSLASLPAKDAHLWRNHDAYFSRWQLCCCWCASCAHCLAPAYGRGGDSPGGCDEWRPICCTLLCSASQMPFRCSLLLE